MFRKYKSHGSGKFQHKDFKKIGKNVVFEKGVLVFHPENITIGDNVYIGHNAIIKGYYKNEMIIGNNCWIGQNAFLHSGGGLVLAEAVGIGPGVIILTHYHKVENLNKPIIATSQIYKKVIIETGCDIGVGSIILSGVTIGKYSLVGAGSVVTKDVKPYSIVVGNPARLLRKRI
ncbi:hypothetical protein A2697_01690 [Candidatus Curtissbacteria bacterium RIFCSPHIGHO2_01_FULL_41_44]|uniref:Transferase n=1 Tax=Candidatus Curtissbacteria bacterium RIFCSPLOWO2_01_FULL_42_50 TaxID=1797730 RepID=A0A1F5H642_9BACT|nr:MAG: hypothetical protein A2697_01690 [Candidatus Curtissbacteria bacterium RIFCSPHIGHO2_01_FULL_41_44]OGD99643.1 MAG: hypothetical protein A3B54_03065 [Candidatus Curtissbacteria bacterium RIFCSPLOWO2_01_FULL_42_50]